MDSRLEGEPWRQWLRTGTQRNRIDLRRGNGAHRRIKKVLIEGKENGTSHPERWEGFSSSMDRHTVDEALNALPEDHRTVVKLAYFYGLTNRQIAEQLGVTVGTVRTRLRQGLATASAYVERGRAATSKALYGATFGLVFWLTGKPFVHEAQRQPATGPDHVLQASIALAAGVAAVAVFLANPVSPAQLSQFDRGAGPFTAGSAPATNAETAQPREVEVSLSTDGASAAQGVITGVLPQNVLPSTITTTVPSGPVTITVPPIKVPDRILPAVPSVEKPLL